jgi:hypothetical protein
MRLTLTSILKGRSGDPFELVGSTSERVEVTLNVASLEYGSLDGPAVTMAFLADDKTYVRCFVSQKMGG